MRYEIIQSKPCHNYDDFQYPNIIFSPKEEEEEEEEGRKP
jgi:hypothetical protein